MHEHLTRVYQASGEPYAIGLTIGQRLGPKLEHNIQHYLAHYPDALDVDKLRSGALPWLRRLPSRFQAEYAGLAAGAQLPLQRLAEWAYVEECATPYCSGAICMMGDEVWVARNNDLFVPELWGYVTIRAVTGHIPTISFCMEGDVFTPTGINQERLWLHYNYLPVSDAPTGGKPHWPAYVFLTEALETCRTIAEVEARLQAIDRDGGMVLFAVDGKTGESAVFECTCTEHFRRTSVTNWLVGTNHFCLRPDPLDSETSSSQTRFRRLEQLVQQLYTAPTPPRLPQALMSILADSEIERSDTDAMTVYANVACPGNREIWYTFGGYPAASRGNWQRLPWPWDD